MDRDKLIKLMALTSSENEHEAMNAMRAANRLLKDSEFTWEKVLNQAPQFAGEYESLRLKYNDLVVKYNRINKLSRLWG